MGADTCAACDCGLEDRVIVVTVHGRQVEVCSRACAQALVEAQAAVEADAPRNGRIGVPSSAACRMLRGEARRLPTAAGRNAG